LGTSRLDTDRRQLVRDGREEHLSPKAFDLLVSLLDARPNVVSKETLMDRLWPDAFVSEANLAVLVAEVRTALGDSARAPRLIRTHHGHGYSVIGDVVELPRSLTTPPLGPTAALHVGTRRIVLGSGESTVGRDPDCDVTINDASISRHHARILVGA